MKSHPKGGDVYTPPLRLASFLLTERERAISHQYFTGARMAEHWLDVADIPEEGREFTFDDQEFWTAGWREFHMEITPARPLAARFMVVPQGRGVLVRGRLEGSVKVPCDRCAVAVEVFVRQDFERLEEESPPDTDSLEPTLLRRRGHVLELDAGSMLWEEFVLALPVKPLCSEACKGICPHCGKDLNAGACGCEISEFDPRLAVLRGLSIAKKE